MPDATPEPTETPAERQQRESDTLSGIWAMFSAMKSTGRRSDANRADPRELARLARLREQAGDGEPY